MAERIDQREAIAAALKDFQVGPLADAGRRLLNTLGYSSDRRLALTTVKQFIEQLDPQNKLTEREREALNQLTALHFLFQLTDAELDAHGDLLDDRTAVQNTKIESYLVFAAELPDGQYPRTALSTLVRAINKPLPMPALVLFRHGDSISIGIIHRRLNRRDQGKDVLEKVTLIKDINVADPIRAHLEILNDFALANLDADFGVSNFVRLHEAWQKRLGSYALSNEFYREIADWYFWAHHQVEDGIIRLPQHCDTEQEKSLFLIRLLTRVIFCWFLVEKRLIPTDLFREHRLRSLLTDFTPSRDAKKPDTAPAYYRAILQNLFFGTLNMPPEQRGFREKKKQGERYDKNFGITNLWRYETAFRARADWEKLATRIPFLNGGLFDCLDDKSGKKKNNFILDGFSDREDYCCHLPNDLFFGPERTVDLSRDYGEEDKRTARSKKAKVRGLIEILSRYKFTIEENTPLEEEIALDPELLGKVFENLLASYNEDTRTTARKALGAFYTPREIVSYMVDEALKSYLKTSVEQTFLSASSISPAIIKTRRNLPHWKTDAALYWITFRMADSLPQDKLRAWREEREAWTLHHPEPWSDEVWKGYEERFGERLEAWLDAGMGSRALARPDVREAVKDCLLKFDGQRLLVHAAVIMPNHVHALIEPFEGQDLSKLLQGIKGASAREANKLLGQTGSAFWMDESYDHIVRSQRQYEHFTRYIAENPVKAGLKPDEFWLNEGGADIPACDPTQNRQTRMSASLSRALDDLFSNKATLKEIKPDTRDALIAAIGRVKILDPACGSGAFPMGALHRLVDLLQKLDPNNESWKRDRLAEARRYRQLLEQAGGAKEEIAACDARIADIEKSFDTRYHALDFARKLYLIENCIYGVDIQPIATQIAKLRFFISLVVDQKVEQTFLSAHASPSQGQTGMSAPPWNLGIRPLPNLETKFVAADTLIPIEKTESDLFSSDLDRLRAELADIRHQHFNARSPAAKRKWREADEAKRREIAEKLEDSHALSKDAARKLAAWDPYDQNTFAPFFDSEWMFGLPVGKVRLQGKAPATLLGNLALINDVSAVSSAKAEAGGQGELTANAPQEIDSGFDVVIGNPPYLFITQVPEETRARYLSIYETAAYRFDVYGLFIESSIRSLLRKSGQLTFIIPHTLLSNDSFEKLRRLILTETRLEQVIDIGPDVFPGAKNETMVFLLGNEASPLDAKGTLVVSTTAKTFPSPVNRFQANQLEWLKNPRATWLVNVSPNELNLISKMERAPLRLGRLCSINQGLRTGDNDKHLSPTRQNKKWRPAAGGKEVGRYEPLPDGLFVYYEPSVLDAPRRLEIFESPEKLVVQEIRNITLLRRIVATYDDKQFFCLQSTNVINLLEPEGKYRLKYLLGILNSEAVNFYFRLKFPGNNHIPSNQLAEIPVPIAEARIQSAVCGFVDFVLFLNHRFANTPAAQTTRDPLMVAYWEQVLNGLVYELYFPDELHAASLCLFDLVAQAQLPDINSLPESDRLPRLRAKFEELHDGPHPLRIALDKLQTLDPIRIIEGKA